MRKAYGEINLAGAFAKVITWKIAQNGNAQLNNIIKILKYLYEKFSNLERISCYAMPMNILKKTPEELNALNDTLNEKKKNIKRIKL